MAFKRFLAVIALILVLIPCAFAKKASKEGSAETSAQEKPAKQKKEKSAKPKSKKSKGPVQNVQAEAAEQADKQEGAANEAGEEEEGSEENESPEQGWQVLEWEDDKNRLVSRYEIVIQERNKKGVFVDLLTLETKDNTTQAKIEPPLPPGFYRYKVVSYNLFNMPKAQSEWEDFTIYKAYKPRVNDAVVSVNLNSNIYLDYKNDGIISFGGRNLFMPPEAPDDISFTEYVLQSSNGRIVRPLEITEHSDNNRKITFKFDMNDLDVGKYSLVATDASGLTNDIDKSNLLTVRFKKWMDLNLSVGYICPIVLFDDTIKTYFEKNIFPLGANARLTFFPFKRRWGNLGIGVSGSYTYMSMEKPEYKLSSFLGSAHLYLAYAHTFFNKRLALEAHVGAGVTALLGYAFEFEHDIKTDPQTTMNISYMAGAAAQVYVFKHLYVELNVDFVMFIIPDDMTFGAVMPSAGVGWQF